MSRLRLFVGTPLPASMAGAYADLRGALGGLGGVKWVERENLHLTLKFLGHVEGPAVPAICSALQAVAESHARGTLRPRRLTAFPSSRSARVLVVELEDLTEAVTALQSGIERGLAALGFASETRDFRTHVTLGRVREEKVDARAALAEVAPPAGDWEVTGFELIESRLGPRGSSYSTVESFGLG